MSRYIVIHQESDTLTQEFIAEAKLNTNKPNFDAPHGAVEWQQKPLGSADGKKRRIYIPVALFDRLAKEGVFGKMYGSDGIFPC